MSRFIQISFFAGFILGALQFLIVINSGAIVAGIFWGIVPAWFWATHQKLKQDKPVSAFEGVASYAVVIYGGILALVTIFCLFSTFAFLVVDADVIQAAIEQQPNYDDYSEEELTAINQVIEWLPALMPVITLAFCIQTVAYIGYGLAVVRNYTR